MYQPQFRFSLYVEVCLVEGEEAHRQRPKDAPLSVTQSEQGRLYHARLRIFFGERCPMKFPKQLDSSHLFCDMFGRSEARLLRFAETF